MFGSLQPTSYDLQFSLFGIPVRVMPWFWVAAVILGWTATRLGFEFLAAWVAIVFVSILVHEMGHALMAAAFGYPPRIVMYHFGGLAMFEPYSRFTTGKSILITLAGPGAGFILFGLTLFVNVMLFQTGAVQELSPLADFILTQMIFVNLVWGLVNLLPVLPLDGGQICRDVCTSISPHRGMEASLVIAIAVGAAVAVFALRQQQLYMGILFGMLAFENFQELQRRRYL